MATTKSYMTFRFYRFVIVVVVKLFSLSFFGALRGSPSLCSHTHTGRCLMRLAESPSSSQPDAQFSKRTRRNNKCRAEDGK